MMNEKPTGERFTYVYRDRSQLLPDSKRMRLRLGELLVQIIRASGLRASDIAALVRREVGVSFIANYASDLPKSISSLALDDMLDCVTVLFNGLAEHSHSTAAIWRHEIARILAEERISLYVDEKCGVHLSVDEEFANNRQTAISALGSPRYNAAADFFDEAYAALDEHPADTRHAVRAIYEAIENVFKLMLPGEVSRLGKPEIDKALKPKISAILQGHDLDAAKLMLSSLSEWVNGMQQYRHAQGVTEPSGPPMDLAIFIVSAGSSYLRWLLTIDAALNPPS